MNTFTREYFQKHYGSSDRKNPNSKIQAYGNLITDSIPKTKSKIRILDIGCGYGKLLSFLENDNKFETYGIDAGKYAIERAKKKAPKTKFWVATIGTFRPKIRFQIICAFDVLEHIKDLDNAIKKIYDLLEKNGHFFCVVPVYDGIMGKIGGFLDKDETHVHKKKRKSWIKKLGEYFTILSIEGVLRYDFPMIGYMHFKSRYLAAWGQAILISMSKTAKNQ